MKRQLAVIMTLALLALVARPLVAVGVDHDPLGSAVASVGGVEPLGTAAQADWVIECVDCPKTISRSMTDRSLRLDAAGNPHIVYGGDGLYHAWHTGVQWHYETVDTSRGVGGHVALALDGSGYMHVSYRDSTNDALKYAYQDASGWHSETVDISDPPGEANLGYYTSIDVDDSGYAHIGYYDDTNEDLKYAYQDASGWHIEVIDTDVSMKPSTSLALDGDGLPHVSYFGQISLRYAYRDGSGWHTETAEAEGGWYSSLTLDGDGYPHISHIELEDVYYTYRDDSGWHTHTVEHATGWEDAFEDTSLALDDSGRAHISYCFFNYPLGLTLKYAYRDGITWHTQTVDYTVGVGFSSSLALDDGGYVHISYYDYTNQAVKYAREGSSGWEIETVDNGTEVGEGTSLALDSGGYAHISYQDGTSDHLKYAYQDGSGWTIEVVDASSEVGSRTSLALDGSGYAHISYRDWTSDFLLYAHQDGSGWDIQPVDSDGDYPSLALDGNGDPHIVYIVDPFGDSNLMHAWYEQSPGWSMEAVDSGRYPSLALDANGYAHIAYYYYSHDWNELRYAYRDASGWYTQTVDVRAGPGLGVRFTSRASLGLDVNGYARISYFDYGNEALLYAYQDASGWFTETVDAGLGYVGSGAPTSLAIDESGQPHISYYDRNNEGLKYAYWDGSGWHIETVDSAGAVGWYGSLALDSSGQPHISYLDSTNSDLKYAYRLGEAPRVVYLPLVLSP